MRPKATIQPTQGQVLMSPHTEFAASMRARSYTNDNHVRLLHQQLVTSFSLAGAVL